jgi:topoisomerase IA-like protein
MYEDKEIILKNGVYGYYLSYNNKNYKILENYDKNLSLEEALECLKENNDKKIGDYIIKTGKYGPYILFNKKFYNIPQKYNIENITKDQCYEIIQLSKKN